METNQTIDVNSNEKQNVGIAAKLLSWNTAKALLWAGDRKLLDDISYKPLSILIELINEWFNIHNSKALYGVHQGVNAYGTNLEKQSRILDRMS